MPDKPQSRPERSFIEKQPAVRGPKLAALIFVLWVPLAILVLGVSAIVEVNAILLAVFAVGTIFSLGLGLAALKTR